MFFFFHIDSMSEKDVIRRLTDEENAHIVNVKFKECF